MAQPRVGGQRLAAVLAVGLGVLVVVAAAVLWPRGAEQRPAAADGDHDVAACLGPVLDSTDGPCADLRRRLAAQDPATVEVVVLVPASEDGDRAAEAITAAAGMWQDGLASLSGEDGGDAPAIEVSTTRLDPGTAVHPLLDPEVVVVAASAAASDDGGAAVEVYDVEGTRCAVFDDAFALPSWTERPGFARHHRLPEGIHRQPCGTGEEQVCVAVNATFDPAAAADVDPFEQFGLVGDELGHCLRLGATTRPR